MGTSRSSSCNPCTCINRIMSYRKLFFGFRRWFRLRSDLAQDYSSCRKRQCLQLTRFLSLKWHLLPKNFLRILQNWTKLLQSTEYQIPVLLKCREVPCALPCIRCIRCPPWPLYQPDQCDALYKLLPAGQLVAAVSLVSTRGGIRVNCRGANKG